MVTVCIRGSDHSGSEGSGGIISSSFLDDKNVSILSLRDPTAESSLPWKAPRPAARSITLRTSDKSSYEMVGSSDMISTVTI